jgi:hypothetical protein
LDGQAPRYRPGDPVRVRRDNPQGHHRTRGYVKGRSGRIESICGVFHDPETRAYGGLGLPKRPLYRVTFDLTEVWEGYVGPRADSVAVDIYEHWLEPEQTASGSDQ